MWRGWLVSVGMLSSAANALSSLVAVRVRARLCCPIPTTFRSVTVTVAVAVAEAAVAEGLAGVELPDIVQQVEDAMWQPGASADTGFVDGNESVGSKNIDEAASTVGLDATGAFRGFHPDAGLLGDGSSWTHGCSSIGRDKAQSAHCLRLPRRRVSRWPHRYSTSRRVHDGGEGTGAAMAAAASRGHIAGTDLAGQPGR